MLFMCGTGGDPRGDAAWSGWVEESEARGFILVTPDYENYATYSQVPFMKDVLDWASRELPVDKARVYSVGFSNGGAASVALTSESPGRVAAIRSLMRRDGLLGVRQKADYAATPYWGYAPDATSSEQSGGFTWDYSNYRKDGYESPFAQLVLVNDDVHRPRADEARIAWNFLRHFSRQNGRVVESWE